MRYPSRQYPHGADRKVLPAIVHPCGKDTFENYRAFLLFSF
jgi:hypothetical protein